MLITSGGQRVIEGFPSLFLIFACTERPCYFKGTTKHYISGLIYFLKEIKCAAFLCNGHSFKNLNCLVVETCQCNSSTCAHLSIFYFALMLLTTIKYVNLNLIQCYNSVMQSIQQPCKDYNLTSKHFTQHSSQHISCHFGNPYYL